MSAPAAADTGAIWAALAEVADPEMPAISVVDLGVIRSVERTSERVRIELLPTFVGCPAIDLMRAAIEQRLARFAPRVDVVVTFTESWTSERITAEGRRRLEASGFAAPAPNGPSTALITLAPRVRCPLCGSHRTRLENAFGPTLCRAIHYCMACRQPFEEFKAV